MKTFLLRSFYSRVLSLSIAVAAQCLFLQQGNAQCINNLLVNGSFESPVVPVVNGNNIMGVGVTWGGWDCNNGGINIIRVQGSGYGSGSNHGDDGNQYVDVANSDGYIYQSFVLDHATPVFFSGAFSNREAGWGSFVNWTGRVDILNSTGTIVATSTTRSFITTDAMEPWYTLMGSSSSLPPGTYMYRAYAGNSGHFDNAYVCGLANTVLPVKLQRFTASLKNNQVELEWLVGEEKDLNGYEIQYSLDGIQFKTLDFVKAADRAEYKTFHKNAAPGYNYYRLKMHDIDGKSSYSNIARVDVTTTVQASLYPNPARGSFSVVFNNELSRKTALILIVAPGGRVVQQKRIISLSRTETIDISKLAPGTYFMNINVDGKLISQILNVAGH